MCSTYCICDYIFALFDQKKKKNSAFLKVLEKNIPERIPEIDEP